ncbi:MAG TPA: 3-hydroxyacyl-ACP dehydratase FabZ [Gammaproteobacteria bacterium]|uniref:3-hydroxyacyl-[acyl-carrier-protein] dehydratase n=1 Tax=hydrothermal vent metagenome TaxID=652676 RepID=A0A3B0YH81_9ZZZZ|nr:3-hydroxyacyl-ACP dehydratase FabZ [Gammaproteobacteria bacterium]
MMDINEIRNTLPHRYPFLLVDRVLEFEAGKSLVAIKNVSFNEPFFQGHFPEKPVMPGVLILEALAQATGLLAFRTEGRDAARDSLYYFVGVDKARFKRPVEPGDQLRLAVDVIKVKRGIWVFDTSATVDGKIAATAVIMCTERKIDE